MTQFNYPEKTRIAMKAIKPILITGVVLLILNQIAFSCCPDGRLEGPDGNHFGLTPCDPAFYCPDFYPIKSVTDRRAEFWSATHAAFDKKKTFSETEMQAWRGISQQMAADREGAYSVAISVWPKPFSAEFKRMTFTKAMALVDNTEQVENLKFLEACLENANEQKQNCLALAKGNGLQRQLASRRLALLNSNSKLSN